MSRTILIECSPRAAATGAVVPLRLVFKARERANFLGVQWHPAVEAVPAFESSLGFDGRSFGAAPSPQIGELVFALTSATRFAASLVWKDAAVTVRMANWPAGTGDAADGDFATIWTGRADDIASGGGQARVRLIDAGQALRVPALAAKFGTSGDALLDSADATKDRTAETRVPRAWGKLLSIPGLIVDRANGVWLFAGNAATSVQAFYDGGAAFTLGTARANLAALQANIPAAGTVDYCLDAGGKFLARPWTAPTYPFTAAATFGSTTAADIASAIVTGRTAVTFAAGTVAAFNALQGAEHGLYLDDDTSVAAALDRLFSGLGAWWRLSGAGTIMIGRWAWTTPTLTFAAHRRHAPDRLRIIAPTRRRSLGYARNDRVHNESEIARILLAGDLNYADGTSIEALKPGEIGATAADNMVANAGLASSAVSWSLDAGISRQVAAAGDPAPGYLKFNPGAACRASANNGAFLPLAGGVARLFLSGWAYRNTAAAGVLNGDIYWRKADGTASSTPLTSVDILPVAALTWVRLNNAITVPADAASCWISVFANVTGASVNVAGLRVAGTERGADVTSTAVPSLSVPPLVTINYDFDGTAAGGALPATLRAIRKRGDTDVSASTTWSLTGSGFTASISSDGEIEITATSASSTMTVVSVRDGVTLSSPVAINRIVAPPPSAGGTGGTSVSDSTIGSIASNSYGAAIAGTLTVKTGTGGIITLTAPLTITRAATAPAGTFGVFLKWQYRIVGGSYADAAAEVAEATSLVVTDEGGGFYTVEDGSATCNVTLTGLAATTDYEVELLGRTSSGTTGRGMIGTAAAVGS